MRNQVLHVARFYLLARHDLLDGRQMQDDAQHRGQGAMIPQRTVIENQILQVAALDSHRHGTVEGVEGRDDPRRA